MAERVYHSYTEWNMQDFGTGPKGVVYILKDSFISQEIRPVAKGPVTTKSLDRLGTTDGSTTS